jgi:redox-sensing transcriptional repressor
MAYPGFTEFGLKIVAAFDSDPAKVGSLVRDVVIESTDGLVERLSGLNAHIGIITVPGDAAQDVCDKLVEGGVMAIWNFAPVHLALPEHVIIQNENLAARLSHLSHQVVSLVHAK